MTSMQVEQFVKAPSLDVLLQVSKKDLLLLGKHLGLTIKTNLRKAEIRNVIIRYFVDNGKFDSSALDSIEETVSSEIQIRQMELENEMKLRQMEIDKEKEMREREIEKELREKETERDQMLELEKQKIKAETELRIKELELASQDSSSNPTFRGLQGNRGFDVSRNIRLVPPFQEKEVDKYFLHFEKITDSMKWPEDKLTMLLQSVLIGKARDIYSSLSVDDISNYQVVKKAILKAYELVPEAYCLKFRNSRKRDEQTHVEFAREKEQMFNRWCDSKEIDEDFGKLRQLLLIEEFKRCVHINIKTHLDERKVETLSEAATMADDYALTQKGSFVENSSQDKNSTTGTSKFGQPRNPTFSGPSNDKPKLGDKTKSDSKTDHRAGVGSPSGPVCN
ncbi:uncharacterized protein [Argopecten irradians]|uniref:uncharacterized protein n=1 Tax=Argopecten irradians TaxID=31199 RepID=UPI003711933C